MSSLGSTSAGSCKDLNLQDYFNKMGALFNPDKCKKTIDPFNSYTKEATNIYSTNNPDLIEAVLVAQLGELDTVVNLKMSDKKYKVKFTCKAKDKVTEEEYEIGYVVRIMQNNQEQVVIEFMKEFGHQYHYMKHFKEFKKMLKVFDDSTEETFTKEAEKKEVLDEKTEVV